jgi:type VI secretion system protein ImpA
MDQGRIFDLDALVAPLPGGAPTGVDVRSRESPQAAREAFIALRDARRAARALDRKAEESGNPAVCLNVSWRDVFEQSPQILLTHSKDLEVACWFVEVLARGAGFPGLRDGFALLDRLLKSYPKTLHSLRDTNGWETFMRPIALLDGGVEGPEGTLIQPIRLISLTQGGPPGPFSAYHYQQALSLDKLTDKAARDKRLQDGIPTTEIFEQALRSSPKDFLHTLEADLAGALSELTTLRETLRQICQAEAPPTSKIRATLESVRDLLAPRFAVLIPREPVKPPPPPQPPGEGVVSTTNAVTLDTNVHVSNGHGALTSREGALNELKRVAEYFRNTEPHSPIAFALDDLVRRARLSLPELLVELIPDAAARKTFLQFAGIKPQDPAPAATPQKS